MLLKKRFLQNCKLYLVLDTEVNTPDEILFIAVKTIRAGVDIIQLRDKKGFAKDTLILAKKLVSLAKGKIPFIVNDRIDIALLSGASGVHLGQDDLPLVLARKILGKNAIIGASAQTYAQAIRAVKDGADYIGFGSVFKTLTKPDRKPMELNLLQKVYFKIPVPVFPIGGINLENIHLLKSMEIKRAAVTRAISKADDPALVAKNFKINLS